MTHCYKCKNMVEMVSILDRISERGVHYFSTEYYPTSQSEFETWGVLTYNNVKDEIGCIRTNSIRRRVDGDSIVTLEEFELLVGIGPKTKHYGSKLVFNFI